MLNIRENKQVDSCFGEGESSELFFESTFSFLAVIGVKRGKVEAVRIIYQKIQFFFQPTEKREFQRKFAEKSLKRNLFHESSHGKLKSILLISKSSAVCATTPSPPAAPRKQKFVQFPSVSENIRRRIKRESEGEGLRNK